jgi:hypothetical protein
MHAPVCTTICIFFLYDDDIDAMKLNNASLLFQVVRKEGRGGKGGGKGGAGGGGIWEGEREREREREKVDGEYYTPSLLWAQFLFGEWVTDRVSE